MSQKITAKNLTYDSSLPPFLARLHGHREAQTGPDPILAAHRRPGQKRSAEEEAEDAPVVVDEEGNVVDLAAIESKDITEEGDKEGKEEGKDEEDKEGKEGEKREKVAGIGATRKRKVGRVIADEDEEGRSEKRIAKASEDVRRLLQENTPKAKGSKSAEDKSGKAGDGKERNGDKKTVKSVKKKTAKKIKLSFGDEEGE